MHSKKLFLSSIFVAAALIAPMAMKSNAAAQVVSVRVYDRDHKDYHNWDDHEAHAYLQFRGEHPKYNATFSKTTKRQKSEYWNWRHSHPD